MSPRASKLVGTLFLTLAVLSLILRVFAGTEFTLIPWPVSLVVAAIGVFFLWHGTSAGTTSRPGKSGGSP